MEIYHGSNVEVKSPKIIQRGFYKDFGFGFYCTSMKKQAIKWALTKKPKHVVNCYELVFDSSLKIKKFPNMSEEWLDFIAQCRNGICHTWDIIEGPMADDTIWFSVEDFLEGTITMEAFWELVKFKHPTHQIVFCNDNALNCIKFKGSEIF